MVAVVESEKKSRFSRSKFLKSRVWSPYQQALFDFGVGGSGHGIVNAVAGSGKSTSLVGLVASLPASAKIAVVAFNNHSVADLAAKMPSTISVSTAHKFGMSALFRFFGEPFKPNDEKMRNLCRSALDGLARRISDGDRGIVELPESDLLVNGAKSKNRTIVSDSKLLRRSAASYLESIIHFAMASLSPLGSKGLVELEDYFCVEYDFSVEFAHGVLLPMVEGLISKSVSMAIDKRDVSLDELLYLPVRLKLTFPAYDFVLQDECLPGRTPVLLADGSSKTIQEIVENQLPVKVLAYDTETGEQKACKVTKWSRTPNYKPLVKITTRRRFWDKHGVSRCMQNFVVCTVDHKVWADNQWVEAGDLKTGMVAQVETSAEKSHAYKISSKGKARLSQEMSKKNELEICGNNPRTEKCKGIFNGTRGGNGTGLTVPQQVLMERLEGDWVAEFAVKTRQRIKRGYPAHYKIDLALPSQQIAIEIDGQSHRSPKRRNQDKKKQDLLESMGWTVLRFKNVGVMQNLVNIANQINALTCVNGQDCPVDAEIIKVESTNIPEYWVYDLTVEGCHNFYANGVLVHNCQDASNVMMAMIGQMASSGRLISVGDKFQSIQGFTGAAADSFDRIAEKFSPTKLDLSICYRCPSSHLDLARRLVPGIQDKPDAVQGAIAVASADKVARLAKLGDLMLCRFTAPLVSTCLELIGRGIKARVRGRDIGAQIASLAEKITGDFPADFSDRLTNYCLPRIAKMREDEQDSKAQSMEDRLMAVRSCFDSFGFECRNREDFCRQILSLFCDDDDKPPVTLATIHRSKGDAADRVWILGSDFLPFTKKARHEWQEQQELNLTYVALTRSTSELFLVPIGKNAEAMLKHPLGGLCLPKEDKSSEIIAPAPAPAPAPVEVIAQPKAYTPEQKEAIALIEQRFQAPLNNQRTKISTAAIGNAPQLFVVPPKPEHPLEVGMLVALYHNPANAATVTAIDGNRITVQRGRQEPITVDRARVKVLIPAVV